jgi:hypothetical protein
LIRCFLVLILAFALPAEARVLTVGPNAMFAAPSAAARAARDGDTVEIAAGSYYDCSVWPQSALTIEGTGADTIITDNACQGKAAFVITGNDVTVRRLVLTRIRVEDWNGAGIRGEGRNLTIEDVSFINDQFGVLVGSGTGTVQILNSRFDDDGDSPEGHLTHAVRVSADALRIEHSTFTHARAGDHVSAEAKRITLIGNEFDDEGGKMRGPLVQIDGDVIVLDGNTLNLSPGAADRPGAVLIDGRPGAIKIENSVLIEPAGNVPLVRNWTGVAAEVRNNRVPDGVDVETSGGRVWHEVRGFLGTARAYAVQYLGRAHHIASVITGKVRSAL